MMDFQVMALAEWVFSPAKRETEGGKHRAFPPEVLQAEAGSGDSTDICPGLKSTVSMVQPAGSQRMEVLIS